jgi:general secretion pathway protein A
VHVSDPQSKNWLADDPRFLASLNDLDRGLVDGEGLYSDTVEALAPAPVPRPIPAPPVMRRPIAPERVQTPRPAAETRARRPLLDLFPPTSLQTDAPPMPFGTAVGPQLPSAPVDAPRTPSSLDTLTYETFYGLREKPFNVSTDPRFHYHSAEHERVGLELLTAMRARSGPAVLTGALGMGKTTLCRALVQQLDRRIVASIVHEPPQSIDDLLKTMLVDFGVLGHADVAANPQLTRDVLTQTVGSFLGSLGALQASAVLFIDEAQHVPVSVLGDLAALASGSAAARVLQLVLVGQPALTPLLRHADLRGLNAAVAHRTELGPLHADEISAYVMHRLSTAGAHTRIEFDDDAIARLFEVSQGTPRIVNRLCEQAMTRGHEASAAVISRSLIDEAAADLDLDLPAGEGRGALSSVLTALGFAVLFAAGASAALYVSRDAVSRTIRQWENIPAPPGGPVRRLPVPIAPIPPPEP